MSSGNVHRTQNKILITALAILGGITAVTKFDSWVWASYVAAAWLAAMLSSTFISPDLDLYHSSAKRAWNQLSFLWSPFAWAVKHRHWKSHSLIGSLLRLAYLLNLVWICIGGMLFLLVESWTGAVFFAGAIALLIAYINALYRSTYLAITLALLNVAPLILLISIGKGAMPWVLAVVLGHVLADLLHLIFDTLDSLRYSL